MNGSFYGPGGVEAAGTFYFDAFEIRGAFGAKRVDESE